jgi:hypothetical protein
MRDSEYCFYHDPDHAEEAAQARVLGGRRRRRERTLDVAYDLDGLNTVRGLRRVLEIAIKDALSLDNGIGRSRVLIAGAAAGSRLLETGDLEQRVSELEAAVRRRPPERDPDADDGLLGGA